MRCVSLYLFKDMGFAVPVSQVRKLRPLFPSMLSLHHPICSPYLQRWMEQFIYIYMYIIYKVYIRVSNIHFNEHPTIVSCRPLLHKHMCSCSLFDMHSYSYTCIGVFLKECAQIKSGIKLEESSEDLLMLHFSFEPAALGRSEVLCVGST